MHWSKGYSSVAASGRSGPHLLVLFQKEAGEAAPGFIREAHAVSGMPSLSRGLNRGLNRHLPRRPSRRRYRRRPIPQLFGPLIFRSFRRPSCPSSPPQEKQTERLYQFSIRISKLSQLSCGTAQTSRMFIVEAGETQKWLIKAFIPDNSTVALKLLMVVDNLQCFLLTTPPLPVGLSGWLSA
jgi:hypothetical protein